MGQSLVQLYVHTIFSTKDRMPLITPEVRPQLFGFLGEFLNRADCPCIMVGGVADHVHLVFRLGKDTGVEKLIGTMKSRSSCWVKREFPRMRGFYWQRGYAAFSLSSTHVRAAQLYVANQEQHHHKESFEAELKRILEKNGLEYDDSHLMS